MTGGHAHEGGVEMKPHPLWCPMAVWLLAFGRSQSEAPPTGCHQGGSIGWGWPRPLGGAKPSSTHWVLLWEAIGWVEPAQKLRPLGGVGVLLAVWPRRLGGAKTTKLRPLDGAKMEAPPTECRQWIPLAGVRPTQKLRPLGVVGGVQWMCVATPTGWSQNPKLHPLGAVKPPQTPPTRSQLGVFQLAGIDHAHLGGAWLKLRPLLCSQPWGCVVCRPRPPHAIGGGALTGRGHGEAPPTKRVQWGEGSGVIVGLWGSLGSMGGGHTWCCFLGVV